MRSVPVKEAIAEISEILIGQTDFALEASNLERLAQLFEGSNSLLVPSILRDLCTRNILCMDYIAGMKKLTDPELPEHTAKEALIVGVRALYKMIFKAGFIHCDMHPGNMLVAPDGRLVILDAGFMVELDDSTRRSFAEFFLAIAFHDGRAAARIVRETATRLPSNLNVEAFDEDISDLIERVGGLKARDFQVAGFVGELFAIQRKHGIYGTSKFTPVILSLLVYEGVAKQRFPDLDFQQEAVPFVIAALAS
jgi:ubiquinone biosynthesis protein